MAKIKMWQKYKAIKSDSNNTDIVVQVYGIKEDRVLYLNLETKIPTETSIDEFTKSFEELKTRDNADERKGEGK